MLEAELQSFIDYFKGFADGHEQINFFLYGSVEKGIEHAKSFEAFEYPFLWLEQPTITPTNNGMGNMNMVFHAGVAILMHAPLDDRTAQESASSNSLTIIYDLLKKFNHENEDIIEIDLNNCSIEMVTQLWADSHYGWRLEFKMTLNANKFLC